MDDHHAQIGESGPARMEALRTRAAQTVAEELKRFKPAQAAWLDLETAKRYLAVVSAEIHDINHQLTRRDDPHPHASADKVNAYWAWRRKCLKAKKAREAIATALHHRIRELHTAHLNDPQFTIRPSAEKALLRRTIGYLKTRSSDPLAARLLAQIYEKLNVTNETQPGFEAAVAKEYAVFLAELEG